MKSAAAIVLLPATALALLITPLSYSSTHTATRTGFDMANNDGPVIHRQIDPKAFGAACSDEGAWFCMSDNFQRCASGEWSIIQKCAPGTQCEPLGLTHNASQPAFSIYDGSSGSTVTVDTSTTAFSVEPVTKTTTTDMIVTTSQTASSSTKTLSAASTSTKTGTSSTSSSSSMATHVAPKADTSGGVPMGRISWSTLGITYICLTAFVVFPRLTVG